MQRDKNTKKEEKGLQKLRQKIKLHLKKRQMEVPKKCKMTTQRHKRKMMKKMKDAELQQSAEFLSDGSQG